ncbi:helix-hairpin-helix domain-containing protein [Algoriphagus boritolerans]|uniref:helix-hairpin-helix domain-containing protein n=1 Tax=Algoriphagus boritolerans TaxID=308111 RepID=UPI003A102FDA
MEIFLGRRIQFEQILEASKKHGTIHMILLDLKLDLPAEVNERIKKTESQYLPRRRNFQYDGRHQSSKDQPFEKVLFALGIRNIGENTAQLLARHFGSIEKLQAATTEQLLEINGVGETLVQSMKEFFCPRRKSGHHQPFEKARVKV